MDGNLCVALRYPCRSPKCFGHSISVLDRCRIESDGSSQRTVTSTPNRRKFNPAKTFRLRKLQGLIVLKAYENEVFFAVLALRCRNFDRCFHHLERAHVLAQRLTARHTRVHLLMLIAGWRRRDFREVTGQVPRLIASVLFSRLWVPPGNTGRSRVGALTKMPFPDDLRHHFS
ncbi:DUF3703 domain-containing protein [Hydrogenophaga sp.]|uniref:DUF3703 domain-containing protein n=1 Tax=Hydrogenophaga sp. TaxID=1904254 RepID=UPI0034317AAE